MALGGNLIANIAIAAPAGIGRVAFLCTGRSSHNSIVAVVQLADFFLIGITARTAGKGLHTRFGTGRSFGLYAIVVTVADSLYRIIRIGSTAGTGIGCVAVRSTGRSSYNGIVAMIQLADFFLIAITARAAGKGLHTRFGTGRRSGHLAGVAVVNHRALAVILFIGTANTLLIFIPADARAGSSLCFNRFHLMSGRDFFISSIAAFRAVFIGFPANLSTGFFLGFMLRQRRMLGQFINCFGLRFTAAAAGISPDTRIAARRRVGHHTIVPIMTQGRRYIILSLAAIHTLTHGADISCIAALLTGGLRYSRLIVVVNGINVPGSINMALITQTYPLVRTFRYTGRLRNDDPVLFILNAVTIGVIIMRRFNRYLGTAYFFSTGSTIHHSVIAAVLVTGFGHLVLDLSLARLMARGTDTVILIGVTAARASVGRVALRSTGRRSHNAVVIAVSSFIRFRLAAQFCLTGNTIHNLIMAAVLVAGSRHDVLRHSLARGMAGCRITVYRIAVLTARAGVSDIAGCRTSGGSHDRHIVMLFRINFGFYIICFRTAAIGAGIGHNARFGTVCLLGHRTGFAPLMAQGRNLCLGNSYRAANRTALFCGGTGSSTGGGNRLSRHGLGVGFTHPAAVGVGIGVGSFTSLQIGAIAMLQLGSGNRYCNPGTACVRLR